jgi:hypothetical protein
MKHLMNKDYGVMNTGSVRRGWWMTSLLDIDCGEYGVVVAPELTTVGPSARTVHNA